MKFLMFTPLSRILPKAIARIGVGREVQAALICEQYRKFAPKLVHPEALNHTLPKNYRNRTLTVGVVNSAWGEQVISRKEELIKAMNSALGQRIINQLKTQIVEKI